MDKSKLKKFATNMRLELIQQVSAKLEFLLKLDIENIESLPVVYKSSVNHLKIIQDKTSSKVLKEEFIEEIAYTWFNRLIALRFMDANAITEIPVLTPLQEGANPAIFTSAKEGTISDEISIDKSKFL